MFSDTPNLQDKAQQGFTIVELMTAILSSGVAIVVGGFGVVSVLSYTQGATTEIEAQKDGAEALDFIASEARQAQVFQTSDLDPSSPFWSQVSSLPSSPTPVMVMQLDSIPEPIVYFLAAASSPWQGTGLYRWGPAFDQEGAYVNAPANTWRPALLVDQVSDSATGIDCNGWQKIPRTASHGGFYACIGQDEKIAEFVFQPSIGDQEVRAKAFARSSNSP